MMPPHRGQMCRLIGDTAHWARAVLFSSSGTWVAKTWGPRTLADYFDNFYNRAR